MASPILLVRDQRSNSPSLVPAMNASHSSAVKISTGPEGFFESRTAVAPSTKATSTQLSQFGPLRELFRHFARPGSTVNPFASNLIGFPFRPWWVDRASVLQVPRGPQRISAAPKVVVELSRNRLVA